MKWAAAQPALDGFAQGLAVHLPVAVLAFFAVQIVIRVLISGNLEVDEAQFVGETAFVLGFGNSHPPLYNWLVAAAQKLSGGHWVVSVALVKNLLLAGHFILAWDMLRRLKADPVAGLMAAAALALLPQVIWQGQVTLAHSVAVGFATLATLHAASLWLVRRTWPSALWLGVAVAVGVLSKYNFVLFLAGLGVAATSIPAIRMRLDRGNGMVAGGVAAILIAPHLVWALSHLNVTTERMGKLYSERNQIVGFDLPLLGIDGLASLVIAVLAWGGPLALVWFGLYRMSSKPAAALDEPWDFTEDFAQLCGRAALICLGIFAVIVLAADMHKVHERYLTPLLIPAVIWLALKWPLEGRVPARGLLASLAALLFVASMIAIPATVAFGPSRLAYPYAAIADDLAATDVIPTDVIANRQDLAANVALRLPDGALWSEPRERRVILLWRRGEQAPPYLLDRIGPGYAPAGPVSVHNHPYANWSGKRAVIRSQVFAPVD